MGATGRLPLLQCLNTYLEVEGPGGVEEGEQRAGHKHSLQVPVLAVIGVVLCMMWVGLDVGIANRSVGL